MTFPDTSGYPCATCDKWIPLNVTHQCPGKATSGAEWWRLSETPDWTSLYLAQIVGLLVKIEQHLNPEIIVMLDEMVLSDGATAAAEIDASYIAHATPNKEKAIAMSDVISGVLLHELLATRSVRARTNSYIKQLATEADQHKATLASANVTINEIERALRQAGVEIPAEAEEAE